MGQKCSKINLNDFEDGCYLFGYIKPKNGELLVKEYEQYRGVYCGLCRSLGTHYGKISRMTLSYDCTFLALFVLGREQTCTGFEKKRCVVNPMKKCTFCMDQNDALHLPAALSVITMYHNDRANNSRRQSPRCFIYTMQLIFCA